jgi:hypothetical protein
MKFKTTTLIDEFNSKKTSPYLRAVTLELGRWWAKNIGKESSTKRMIVTSILRLPAEQVVFCTKGKFKSDFQHVAGEALDLRSSGLMMEDIVRAEAYVRKYLGKVCSLKYHKSGTAPHLHLNLIGQFSDKAAIHAIVKNIQAEEYFTG